ncbi:hypothetical protein HELRODRAFT_160699 [Helobdella robusta]|uniref:Ig-like domain-containing protein n=1 Tax=Helobdella robusta TaxID=6412 RepID=T1EQM3_HELRO|nr:hypothetical protein HELRODRAFT_160699 [Helobdella robusta]ESO06519.1 hypothetical protein HELRODRAFT_160699 [Helobdella robusta]
MYQALTRISCNVLQTRGLFTNKHSLVKFDYMMPFEEMSKFKKKPLPREYFSKFSLLAENWKLIEDDNYTVVNCLPEGATLVRISDPRYKWFGPYSDEVEVANDVFKPISNGKLEIIRARITHSGTYICLITSQSNAEFEVTYSHTFAVFTVPDIFLLRQYYMRSEKCSHEAQIRWADLAIRTYCRGAEECDFKVEIDTCIEAAEKEFETRFSVYQKVPSQVYKNLLPDCGMDCKYKTLKKSLQEASTGLAQEFHLNLVRAYSRQTDELRYQSKETESSFFGYCPDGYEKFNDQVCVPCDKGAYREVGNDSQECTTCGIFHYNDMIGQTSCTRCPILKLTVRYGSPIKTDCIYFFKSWAVMTIVGVVVLICVLPMIYCVVLIRIITKIVVHILTKMCCSLKQTGGQKTAEGLQEQRKVLGGDDSPQPAGPGPMNPRAATMTRPQRPFMNNRMMGGMNVPPQMMGGAPSMGGMYAPGGM